MLKEFEVYLQVDSLCHYLRSELDTDVRILILSAKEMMNFLENFYYGCLQVLLSFDI